MNNNIIIILNFLILLITILLTVFLITNYKETFSESNRHQGDFGEQDNCVSDRPSPWGKSCSAQ